MYRKISFTADELVKSQNGDRPAMATPVLLYVNPVLDSAREQDMEERGFKLDKDRDYNSIVRHFNDVNQQENIKSLCYVPSLSPACRRCRARLTLE